MVYEVMKLTKHEREFRILHDREHYTVWYGGLFIASGDTVKEILEEIDDYCERISRKRFCY